MRGLASASTDPLSLSLDQLGTNLTVSIADKNDSIENESEESLKIGDTDDPSLDDDKPVEEEKVVASQFRDPRLRVRFDRASDLISLGMYDWARWELYEIERRTRHQPYLKLLMNSYEKISSFNRSAYIGGVYFTDQRKIHGITGVRYLWELTYPQAFKEHVEIYSQQFKVEEEFIYAIMRAESHYKKDIMSPVGATGLMQIMANTGRNVARLLGEKSFHERQLTDPKTNIRIGTRYLNRLLKKFKNEFALAAASYNAGPHRVERWLSAFGDLEFDEFIEHIPFSETRNYVKKVIKNYSVYQLLYNKKPKSLEWLAQAVPVKIEGSPAIRETWEEL